MSGGPSGVPNNCYAQCPASTVTIQPPPFRLIIPGPAIYCPNQPFGIQQNNPCIRGGVGSNGGSSLSEFYSQSLPSCAFNYSSHRF